MTVYKNTQQVSNTNNCSLFILTFIYINHKIVLEAIFIY